MLEIGHWKQIVEQLALTIVKVDNNQKHRLKAFLFKSIFLLKIWCLDGCLD